MVSVKFPLNMSPTLGKWAVNSFTFHRTSRHSFDTWHPWRSGLRGQKACWVCLFLCLFYLSWISSDFLISWLASSVWRSSTCSVAPPCSTILWLRSPAPVNCWKFQWNSMKFYTKIHRNPNSYGATFRNHPQYVRIKFPWSSDLQPPDVESQGHHRRTPRPPTDP